MIKFLISAVILGYMGCAKPLAINSDNHSKIQSATIIKKPNRTKLKREIGQMLMLGFYGTSAPKNSRICKDIRAYNIGAVILFDVNPSNRKKPKNIIDKKQLKQLTKELQRCSRGHDLLIAVDQEGGRVQRLKKKHKFYGNFPKASSIHTLKDSKVAKIYDKMATELREVGVNFNLAPVVDLSINPRNVVINKLGRAFGKNPKTVSKYASIFMKQMHRHHIYTSLKHFPGHGSSLKDTHKGFVNVTKYWKELELAPYKRLIAKGNIDTIMSAHIYNAKLDSQFPASLSYDIITELLRDKMGYKGVVITDDLQMGAIAKKYNLEDTLLLSIQAGNDILLFGNQLNPKHTVSAKTIIDRVIKLIDEDMLDEKSIEKAYIRIQKLKNKYL